MFVKFIKNHEIGLNKGQCSIVLVSAGKELIDDGYAEEIKENEYRDYVETWKNGQKKEATKELDDGALYQKEMVDKFNASKEEEAAAEVELERLIKEEEEAARSSTKKK